MINYLIDVSASHPIGMLPTIINHNNDAIEDEFNWIFDSSLNRLTKSVYAPTGSVKAHFGEFVNLSAEYITVKNTDSLNNLIQNAVKNYTVDASNVIYTKNNTETTLYSALNSLLNSILDLSTKIDSLSNTTTSAPVSFSSAPVSLSNILVEEGISYIEPLTYPKNLLYASSVLLKRQNLPKLHYNDIVTGNLYTYYTVLEDSITINDKYTACLDCNKIGTVVDIEFLETDPKELYYRILLNRQDKLYVKVSKNKLNRLLLKCTAISDNAGTVWKVYNYSVVNASDIILENK